MIKPTYPTAPKPTKSILPSLPSSGSPVGGPSGRVGIGHSPNPLHLAQQAMNSAKFSAMDKANDSMKAEMKSPKAPKGLPGC